MTYYPQQPLPQVVVVQQPGQSGLGIASFVMGILALLGFWVPCAGIGLAALGLLFAFAGLLSSRGKGLAIAGLILNIIAFIPVIFVLFVFGVGGAAAIKGAADDARTRAATQHSTTIPTTSTSDSR